MKFWKQKNRDLGKSRNWKDRNFDKNANLGENWKYKIKKKRSKLAKKKQKFVVFFSHQNFLKKQKRLIFLTRAILRCLNPVTFLAKKIFAKKPHFGLEKYKKKETTFTKSTSQSNCAKNPKNMEKFQKN